MPNADSPDEDYEPPANRAHDRGLKRRVQQRNQLKAKRELYMLVTSTEVVADQRYTWKTRTFPFSSYA